MKIRRTAALLLGTALASTALAAPAFAAGPATTVAPSTDVDPAGQDLRVTGSGFNPTSNNKFGVYVAFGPKTADYATNAGIFQATKWVHLGATPSAGQDVMNADGTFDVTLPAIKAKYTDGNGTAVDCLVTQCYIVTVAAHGLPDRSQDTFTPVTFQGGSSEPGEGGGGGEQPGQGGTSKDQTVNVDVTDGGALTLAVAGDSVRLSDAPRGGHATGALQKATVADTRGSDAGWNLVGQVSDFSSADGGVIPGANLAWGPTATTVADGSTGTVTAGAPVKGLDVARTLGTSAGGASGGKFELGAGLDLAVPAGAPAGSYVGTLTLTLS